MIEVLYTTLGQRLADRLYGFYLSLLPPGEMERISRYLHWQDRQRTLFGRLLLIEGLNRMGVRPLPDLLSTIKAATFGKPRIAAPFDFSISHGGDYVVCAINGKTTGDADTDGVGTVGVDVEAIADVNDVNPEDFETHMAKPEWEAIMSSPNPVKTFLTYWTIKESVIKGDGRGLSIPLSDVEVKGATASLYGEEWKIKDISLDDAHICHLAFRGPDTGIRITSASFHTIPYNSPFWVSCKAWLDTRPEATGKY